MLTRERASVFAELKAGVEAGSVVSVVRLERDAEKATVRHDFVSNVGRPSSAHPAHFAVHQVHVEIRKLDVVALCVFFTAAQ